ncbi:hypothetical protein EVAR_19545_1 [Eumeta japonica]|uniref:Uncharacterized protein n=1 Tax=Eumeta variegata TaxID=151549 RepID=A0A4C1UF71_EUMVA|nr:hypothetical protein EVAR_19545_1 [Eumeta japonica]
MSLHEEIDGCQWTRRVGISDREKETFFKRNHRHRDIRGMQKYYPWPMYYAHVDERDGVVVKDIYECRIPIKLFSI